VEIDSGDLAGDTNENSPNTVNGGVILPDIVAGTSVIGADDLSDILVFGGASHDAVSLLSPTTVLQGDEIDILSPLFTQRLYILGDGSTTTVSADISGLSQTINDTVEIDGTRSITATNGSIIIGNPGGQIDGNGAGGLDNLTLNASASITVANGIGQNKALNNLTLNASGAIDIGGAVTLSGSLTVQNGTTVRFRGAVTITGDLTITNATDIVFDGPVTVTGNITIAKGASVNFSGNVAAGGNVTIGSAAAYANIATLTFANNARFDFNGAAAIYVNGNIVFGNAVGGIGGIYLPDSLTIGTNATLTFNSNVNLALAPLSIVKAAAVNASGNVTAGALTMSNVSGSIALDLTTIVASLDITSTGDGSSTFVRINTLEVGSGQAVITSNQIILNGTISDTGAQSSLTLKPYTVSRAIVVGNSPPSATTPTVNNRLDLSSAEIGLILPGFSVVNIGDASAGTGVVYLGFMGSQISPGEYFNKTQIFGGSIIVTRDQDINAAVSELRLVARTGDITVNANARLGYAGDNTYAERNPWIRLEAAANITINSGIYALNRISLTAGQGTGIGNITINSTGSLTTSNAAGVDRRIELAAGLTTGSIILNAAAAETAIITAAGTSSIVLLARGGAITQTQGRLVGDLFTAQAANDINVRTTIARIGQATLAGEIFTDSTPRTINGVLLTGPGGLTLTETDALQIDQITTASGSVNVTTTGSGTITLNNITSSAGGNVTLTADGAIADFTPAADASLNVSTSGLLTLTANTGIGGAGLADLDLDVGTLTATNTVSGDIVLQDTNALTIVGTGVRTLAANGNVTLTVDAGSFTINSAVTAHGLGNIALAATTGGLTQAAGTTISSTEGTIGVNADFLTQAGAIATGGTGTVTVTADTTSITMADGATTTSASGAISYSAVTSIAIAALTSGTGNLTLTATNGALTDNTAAETANLTTTGQTTLTAATGIGAAGAADIDTTINTLTATNTTSGDIIIQESDTLVVNGTGVRTLAGNGKVDLDVDAGSQTLDAVVTAHGAGTVTLTTDAGTLTANAAVSSTTGAIGLVADTIAQNANVSTTTGTITYTADVAGITMADGTTTSTTTGATTFTAATSIALSVITATTGALTLTATAGAITDNTAAETANLTTTGQTTLTAATGLGGGGALDLDTTINTLQATNTASGNIFLQETNALTINGTGLRTLAGDGSIDVDVDAGALNITAVVTAHGAGTITLNADAGTLTLGANASSTTGSITFTADTVAQNANITTGGAGQVSVTADVAGITMQDGTTTQTATGSITYTAATSIALSLLTSTSGNFALTATAGAITDNTLLELANLVTSGTATLTAATGIGATGTADIDTALGSLTAVNNTSGAIVFEEADALTITSGGIVNHASGSPIILTTLAGTLTINGQIRTTGAGHIRLSVAGVDSDLISTAAISSGTGSITLLAARSVNLNTGASLATTGTGTLDVEATAGSITIADNVAVTTAGGNLRLLAAQDVTLSGINVATGSVTVRATAGSVLDAGATLNDVTASALRLFAGLGIGALADPLEITIATLAAAATTGGIRLSEEDDVTVGTVAALSVNRVSAANTTAAASDAAATSDLTTTTGPIELTSRGGSITLTDGINTDTRAITTTTGPVTLTAQNNVNFQASIVSTSGDFTLTATTGALVDQTVGEGALLITTGTATLTAGTGVGAANAGDIDTTITSVTATNTTSGGIWLQESATLVVLGATTQAANAPISILVDSGLFTIDGAVTAHGSGNVYLRAAAGALTVNANLASTSGHVTALASATLTLNADVTTNGSVNAEANLIEATIAADITAGSDVRLLSATNIILGGVITTPANVSLTATAGSITDLDTDNSVDVAAAGLRIVAGIGAGEATNHLDTTVTTLTARATSGGIYLTETTSLTVDDVAVTIQKVAVDATVTPTTDVTQSDVRTTAGNGSIVLVTGGNLIVNDGTAAADTTGVSAHGTGRILLSTTGSTTINADLRSTTGHITVLATATLTLNADVTTGGSGTVNVEANLIEATIAADVTAGADVRFLSATNIVLGGVITTPANVSLTATAGSITDLDTNNAVDVVAAGLRIVAGVGAGEATNHLDTTVTTLTARATSGGIYLTETNALTVDDVAVTIQRVNTDASVTATTDVTQSDVRTTAGNGSIVLVTGGNLIVNDGTAPTDTTGVSAHGSGNILLSTTGSTTINADLGSTSGHITVLATATLTLNADVTTSGTVNAEANNIAATINADITAGSDVRLLSATNLVLGGVITTPANVSLTATAGSITDLDTTNSVDVAAAGLRIVAGVGAGEATNHLDTTVTTLTARATSGGIYLTETNALTVDDVAVTIQRVNTDASVTATTDVTQSDVRTTAGNGSVVLVTGGNLTVNDGTAATDTTGVAAHGSGNILLSTTGSTTVNADLVSTSGHITVLASATLTLNADVTTNGSVNAEANLIEATIAADITAGSDVRLVSATNLVLGGVITTPANVSLTATAGSITDLDTNNAVDVVAAGLRIVAGVGAGEATNHLDTTVATLTARATSGGIYLTETNALTVDDVAVTIQRVNTDATVTATTDATQSDVRTTAGNGSIVLVTGGNLIVNDGTAAADTTGVAAHGSGNILLSTTGSTTVNADLSSTSGHITVLASATLTLNADVTTSGTVNAEANNIAATINADITAGSDVRLVSATNIVLGGVITTPANVSLTATAGSITDLDTNNSVDVVAAGLRIVAGVGAGEATNHLDTTVTTLTTRATSGGIYLTETNALTVDDVAVTIQKVNPDASVTATTDVTQSDVRTTAGHGSIVLVTGGNLTINDGTAAADTTGVSAHGTGNILLSTTGSTTVNADLVSTSGHITVLASATLTLNADVSTNGSVNAEANLIEATIAADITAGSDVRLVSATNLVLGGVITTPANVSLTATAGSITDLDTNNAVDIAAAGLRIVAGVGAGEATNHLDTTVATLTARATSGGIYLTETNALTVDDVAVTIQKVNTDATVTATTDVTQSDVRTTAGHGSIVLVTGGNLIVNDGTAAADTTGVAAHGTGNILLSTTGSTTVNADLGSTSGHVTVLASATLTLNADVTTNGTVNAEANLITAALTADITAGSDVRLLSATNIILGGVITTPTNVALTATAGSITDLDTNDAVDIAAAGLRIVAGLGAGEATNHLDTTVTTLSARATSGGLFLAETNALTVAAVAVTIQKTAADATTSAVTEAAQSDLRTTAGNGAIVVVTGGDLNLATTVVAHGSGNVLLSTTGSITVNADLSSTSGHLTVLATATLALNADLATAGTGTVNLEANLISAALTADVTAEADIRFASATNIVLGGVLTTTANVALTATAGAITDLDMDNAVDVVAAGLRIVAGTNAGEGSNALETTLTTLSARVTSGGLFLAETNALTVGTVAVTIQKTATDATTAAVVEAAQSGLASTAANGALALATGGDLTLAATVSANGTGNVFVSVTGNLTVNADLGSTTGHVTLLATGTLTLNADVATAGAGTVNLEANLITAALTADVTAGADLRLVSATDLVLGGVLTTTANVALTATAGSITDLDTDSSVDVVAAGLRLVAGLGAGAAANALDTTIATLAARVTSGGLYLTETTALTVGTVAVTVQKTAADASTAAVTDAALAGVESTAGNGALALQTLAGALTINAALSAHGSGAVTLTTGGAAGDLVLGATVTSTTGTLTLNASARVLETTPSETPVLVTAGALSLTAVSGIGETGRGDLDVSAPTITLANTGVGSAYIKSQAAATLTGATMGSAGSLTFTQSTGNLNVTGAVTAPGGSITFRVQGALALTNAALTADANLTLQAASLTATNSGLTATTGTAALTTSGATTLNAGSPLSGGTAVTIAAGGNLALAQVTTPGTLDIQTSGNLTTTSGSAELQANHLRLVTGGSVGTAGSPILTRTNVIDVRAGGSLNLREQNPLTAGRSGLDLNSAAGDQVVLNANGGTLGSNGGAIVDRGSGTLVVQAPGDLTLNTSITSTSGNITVNAGRLLDGTGDEGSLLNAANGTLTLNLQNGGGSTGNADLDFTAAAVTATTATGDLVLHSTGATTVVGSGLSIGSGNGTLSLEAGNGTLQVNAAVRHQGGGALLLTAANGALTSPATVTSSSGAITLLAGGPLTAGTVTSGGGAIALTSNSAGITLGTASSSGAITLNAPGTLNVGTITGGAGAVSLTSTAGTITLSGSLTSTTGAITLTARDSLTLGSLTSGSGRIAVTSTSGALSLGAATTAGAIALNAAGNLTATTLTSTGLGAITATSTNGTLTLGTASTTGAITLQSAGNLSTGALSGAAGLTLTSTAGALTTTAALTTTTGELRLSAAGTLQLGSLSTASGLLSVTSTAGGITMNSAATFATTSGAIVLHAQGDIQLASVTSASGAVTITSTSGSLLRAQGFTGTNITTALDIRPLLQAAKIVDLTVLSDSVQVNTLTVFRRTSPTISLYLVFS
jgi:hypothetical protein